MNQAGLAEVLATFGPAYLASQSLPRGAAKVWRAILACRTAALGGHVESCTDCGTSRHVYHSCRNRHCPRCQTRAKEAWLALASKKESRAGGSAYRAGRATAGTGDHRIGGRLPAPGGSP